ncbi:hypothetical protein LCGC14_2893270 [marine sediment metagenome]|uniref:Uncharacterized protein n=1 Tax=marine sediment metagenome TaxID=412755 RepID=A0A0F8YID7_9ZZZZ
MLGGGVHRLCLSQLRDEHIGIGGVLTQLERLTERNLDGDGGGTPQPKMAEAAQGPFDQAGVDHADRMVRPPRYVTQPDPAPRAAGSALLPAGRYLVVGGAPALAALLAERISAAGGTPCLLSPDAALQAEGPFGGLVHLAPMRAPALGLAADEDPGDWAAALGGADMAAYRLVRAHAEGLQAGRMVFASALGGCFARDAGTGGAVTLAGGATGLAKSLREEWPGCRARAVDLDPASPEGTLADILLAELAAPEGRQEIGYPGGARHVFRSIAQDIPHRPARALPQGAVILATGGARGITAEAEAGQRRKHARLWQRSILGGRPWTASHLE